jgi:hypothetical protein
VGRGAAHAGKEREEGRELGLGGFGPGKEKEGERGESWAKERLWAAYFCSFPFPFLFLYSTNSNKSN